MFNWIFKYGLLLFIEIGNRKKRKFGVWNKLGFLMFIVMEIYFGVNLEV